MAEQPTSQKPLVSLAFEMKPANREFKIPLQWWRRKRHLKREFVFFRSLSQLLQLSFFVKCKLTLSETNSLELYSSSERETKFCRRLFTSSIKREIRHFPVVVEQWQRRNGRKSMMHVQSCCFAYSTNCFFDILIAVTVMASYCFYKVQLGTMLESFFHCLS